MINVNDKTIQYFSSNGYRKQLTVSFPGLGLVFTNDKIKADSMRFDEGIQNEDALEYVGCVSSSFAIDIVGSLTQIKGQRIIVTIQTSDSDVIPLFNGIVDSATQQNVENHTSIVAYDDLYLTHNKDIATWYNQHSRVSIQQLLEECLTYFNIPFEPFTLINGTLPAYAAESQVANSLAGLDLIRACCQINGVIGRMNRSGKFVIFELNAQKEPFYISAYEDITFEKYSCEPITKILIRESESDGGTEYGIGDNTYIIQGNMFTFDFTDKQLETALVNLYSVVEGNSYVPFTLDTRGYPFLEPGDVIELKTGQKFLILTRSMTGVNPLKDEFSAVGPENYSDFVSTISSSLTSIKTTMGEFNLIHFNYQNLREINIQPDSETLIGNVKYNTTLGGPVFMGQVIFKATPELDVMNVGIRYSLNGDTLLMQPKQTCIAGWHTIPLLLFLNRLEKSGFIDVYMTCVGGTVDIYEWSIEMGIHGQGKATAAVDWDGTLVFEESIKRIPITSITMRTVTEQLTTTLYNPNTPTMTESVKRIPINIITFKE